MNNRKNEKRNKNIRNIIQQYNQYEHLFEELENTFDTDYKNLSKQMDIFLKEQKQLLKYGVKNRFQKNEYCDDFFGRLVKDFPTKQKVEDNIKKDNFVNENKNYEFERLDSISEGGFLNEKKEPNIINLKEPKKENNYKYVQSFENGFIQSDLDDSLNLSFQNMEKIVIPDIYMNEKPKKKIIKRKRNKNKSIIFKKQKTKLVKKKKKRKKLKKKKRKEKMMKPKISFLEDSVRSVRNSDAIHNLRY